MTSLRSLLVAALLFLNKGSQASSDNSGGSSYMDEYKAGVVLQPYSILYKGVLTEEQLERLPTWEQVRVLEEFTNTFVQDALREHIKGVSMAETTVVAPKKTSRGNKEGEQYGLFLGPPNGCNHNDKNHCFYYLVQYQTVTFFTNASNTMSSAQLTDLWVNDIWNSKAIAASSTLSNKKKKTALQLLLSIDDHNPQAALYVDELREFFDFNDDAEGYRQKENNPFHTISHVELWHGSLDTVAQIIESEQGIAGPFNTGDNESGFQVPLGSLVLLFLSLGLMAVVAYYYSRRSCRRSNRNRSGSDPEQTKKTMEKDGILKVNDGDVNSSNTKPSVAVAPALAVTPTWAMPQDNWYVDAISPPSNDLQENEDDDDNQEGDLEEQFEDELNLKQEKKLQRQEDEQEQQRQQQEQELATFTINQADSTNTTRIRHDDEEEETRDTSLPSSSDNAGNVVEEKPGDDNEEAFRFM